MSFAKMHRLFEQSTDQGVGIAVSLSALMAQARKAVAKLGQPAPGINRDVPLANFARVNVSFDVDSQSLQLSANGEISVDLTIWLHPKGSSAFTDAIVTVKFELRNSALDIDFDVSSQRLTWVTKNGQGLSIMNPTWDPTGQNLIKAGFKDQNEFEQSIYYGFIWEMSARLVSSIVSNLPIPQLQTWFSPFKLEAPISCAFTEGYFAIWANQVTTKALLCGQPGQSSTTALASKWEQGGPTDGDLSGIEDRAPALLIYMGAQRLLEWKAQGLMPAVMIDLTGGSFVKWHLRAAVGLKDLLLTLETSKTGGELRLDAGLALIGSVRAYVDGPSGTQPGQTVSLTADAHLQATASLNFNLPSLTLDLDTGINVDVDKNSVNLTGSWPLAAVIADVTEFLVKRGAIQIGPLYNQTQHTTLLDLSRMLEFARPGVKTHQRVGAKSVLYGVDINDG